MHGDAEGGFSGTGDHQQALATALAANAAPFAETVEGAIGFDELVQGLAIEIV